MGVPWLAQVRFLHLAIFAFTVLSVFVCVSYINTSTLRTTASPLKSYLAELQMGQGNISLSAGHNGSSEAPPQSQIISQSNHTNNTRPVLDLTRGVPAELIYEAGHIDVSSNICPDLGKNLKLLITITSAPTHDSARDAIRQTWGSFARRKDVAIAFMLGSIQNETINKKLAEEQQLYGDIIRGKFVDTYDNLTLKTISILEWVDDYCSKAAFVLKTDDDMFINVQRLLAFVTKHKSEQKIIYGRLAKKWKPIRNKKSKYYISPQQYKPPVFPDFTTGPAYLLPGNLAKPLYLSALNHTYLKLEDVFLTGIVANGLKIKRVHAPEFLNKRVSFTPCNVQKEISIHMVKSTEQYDLWKKLHDVAKCKK
ncbi:beta-1,3-galactosyltransferase 5-like [Cylas formicarius]|uniref:beta-1,3-galactosyltransferase 5-like n=1 Tax=Cylas formicarius TaxID=197179 RepID=UPI002958B520|nr:beta-1,3-galactosyltransferase 5-like [Cylas formicarius]